MARKVVYLPPKMQQQELPCALCDRLFPLKQLTDHHCLPREMGGNRDHIESICSQCHGMIHATFTNKTLARLYPTVEQLRLAPELQAFLTWVRKQPASRRKRNDTRRRRV